MMDHFSLLYCFDLFGTSVFALSGVLVAARKKMDFVGVVVLATAVAIGGGTIRDLILGAPVFWVVDDAYLCIVLISCILGVLWLKYIDHYSRQLLPILDAIGLAVFLGIGLTKALSFGSSYMIAILLGTLTGVGGGMIRDILAGEIPVVLRSDIYAVACIIGGFCLVLLLALGASSTIALLIGITVTLVVRLYAIKYRLRLPKIRL